MSNGERKEPSRKPLIGRAKEIYKNEEYKKVPSLQGVIDPLKQDLSSVLSIRVDSTNFNHPSGEFFIDTKKFKYHITTQQWLDFVLGQFNKQTGENLLYSPYSNPAYDFLATLLIGYHHFYKDVPTINFADGNIKERNERRKEGCLPLRDNAKFFYFDPEISDYLFYHNYYKPDEKGVYRFSPPWKVWPEWIAFSDNELIVTISYFYPGGKMIGPLEFHIDKNLIPLFLQAYTDVSRRVSGPLVNLTIKKIQQALFTFWSSPEEERNDIETGSKIISNELRKDIEE